MIIIIIIIIKVFSIPGLIPNKVETYKNITKIYLYTKTKEVINEKI